MDVKCRACQKEISLAEYMRHCSRCRDCAVAEAKERYKVNWAALTDKQACEKDAEISRRYGG